LLVDDAETFDDPGGVLSAVIAGHGRGIHVIAAARNDVLRSAYGHWCRDLRRSRLGIALRPDPDDGELFSTQFGRRERLAAIPGRGYLVADGEAELLQVALP